MKLAPLVRQLMADSYAVRICRYRPRVYMVYQRSTVEANGPVVGSFWRHPLTDGIATRMSQDYSVTVAADTKTARRWFNLERRPR